MPSILIESAQILVNDQLTTAHLFLEDGVIKHISKLPPTSGADMKIDGSGLIALPGMIDAHVHLRDLRLSYKETFETGTQAAAVGGFTTVLDMPNTQPATISSANLAEKISRAKGQLFSNVGFQGALIQDSSELKKMQEQGAIAFKLYLNKALETFDSSSQANLETAFQTAKEADVLVTVHAEDGDAIRKVQQKSLAEGKTSIRDFLRAHTPIMEVAAVKRILNLSRKYGARVHICHVTVPPSVKLVKRTPNATCEATSHHLLLNQSVFSKQKTFAICVPPIRSERHRAGLWRLFLQSHVDILASDHAPHSLDEKATKDVWSAAPGVPGLETSLRVMFTQVSRGKMTLRRLVEATATLPAKIFRLPRKGSLREGFDADIVLVDPKFKSVIEPENFLSKAKYSPFKGIRCIGRAAFTIVNGTLIAERGKIIGPPAGTVVTGR